jgi:twitching motility protein PilI
VIRCDVYLAGAFRRGGEVWPVLSLKSLVESQSFLQAAS